jgi:hypothetical protein
MNTNKLWMRFLMASTLLALLFSTACVPDKAITSAAEQALIEKGDAFLTCFKEEDFQAAYGMMSRESQLGLDIGQKLAGNLVDLEDVIMKVMSPVAYWNFDSAKVVARIGPDRGILDGSVIYANGKRSPVHLEFMQQDGAWKVRNFNLEQ